MCVCVCVCLKEGVESADRANLKIQEAVASWQDSTGRKRAAVSLLSKVIY